MRFDPTELEEILRSEFGQFNSGPIRVRPFRIPQIGLSLEPIYFSDYLDNPEWCDEFEEEERAEIRAEYRWWIDQGCSVLNYHNNDWLDGAGEVFAT